MNLECIRMDTTDLGGAWLQEDARLKPLEALHAESAAHDNGMDWRNCACGNECPLFGSSLYQLVGCLCVQ